MIVAAVAVAGGGRGEEGAVPLGSNDRAVLVTVEPHTHSHTEPLTIITKNVNKDPVPASQHAVPTCIHRWSILSPRRPRPASTQCPQWIELARSLVCTQGWPDVSATLWLVISNYLQCPPSKWISTQASYLPHTAPHSSISTISTWELDHEWRVKYLQWWS